MVNFGCSMNESKLQMDLDLFEQSTRLFQWFDKRLAIQ